MPSKKTKMFARAATLGTVIALSFAGAAPAFAGNQGYEPDHYVNDHIYTYSSDTVCVLTRNSLNASRGLPSNNEYYYCGGAYHNELWLRHIA
ncbi:hypothetical protein [Micromonospora chokoriensis]|uniref:hypothetical protein n=1 Tax=Micromonospora chokoriensis TaxID=356851 RepID=UPI0012F7E4A7|nr:hypothetical protein [Micromonospora chokoriensis]